MKKAKIQEPISMIETFRDPRGWTLKGLEQLEPSCMNGNVKIYRWRVTVEKIEEPYHVICERLEYLFRNSDNYHHREPLEQEAKKIGYKFTGEFRQDERSKR